MDYDYFRGHIFAWGRFLETLKTIKKIKNKINHKFYNSTLSVTVFSKMEDVYFLVRVRHLPSLLGEVSIHMSTLA